MSEGAAFNAHWNTPLEAMNGTIDLADAYYCKDGKPTTDTKIAELNNEGGLDVSKPNPAHFENRDPRLYSTLFVPGMLWNGKGGIDTSASNPYVNVYGGAAASLSTIYVYKYLILRILLTLGIMDKTFMWCVMLKFYYLWRRQWYRKEAMLIVM